MSTARPPPVPATPTAAPPTAEEDLGRGQVSALKESEVTPTTVAVVAASSGATTIAEANPQQLKCSLTLDKLPKRLRLALARRKKAPLLLPHNKSPANGLALDQHDGAATAILCLFCDRSWPGRKQCQHHNDQEHLTANRGRRASVRAAAINGFPGCSLCNVAEKLFASHSNDLDALFAHLLEKHADRYFACKPCSLRFRDADALARHNESAHGKLKAKRQSVSLGELSKISDEDESVRFERKVTRQSNTQLSRNTADQEAPSALSRMALAQGSKSSLRGAARAIKGRLAANNQKAAAESGGRSGRNGGKLTRSTSVSSSGSNTFSSSALATNSASNTPPPSGSSSAHGGGGGGAASGSNSSSSSLANGGGGGKSSTNPGGFNNNVFDENFYETITVNVRRNLAKWMDGKIAHPSTSSSSNRKDDPEAEEGGREGKSPDNEDGNISPNLLLLDPPPPAVRSTLFRTPPVDGLADNEIHAATALAAATAFPTLLTAEQYGVEGQAGGKIKRMFTKNSWKWKWDFVKKYKYVNEGGKLVKKAKEQNLGQRDLSKLDMWTQLTMRTKHEGAKRQEGEGGEGGQEAALNSSITSSASSSSSSSSSSGGGIGEAVREEKRRQVDQLDTILDSRLLPQISVEQSEQRLIKLEVAEDEGETVLARDKPVGEASAADLMATIGLRPLPSIRKTEDSSPPEDLFPLSLHLRRNSPPLLPVHLTPAGLTLSGEWARPRCYVCIGCGAKFETIKLLQDHKITDHPNTQTTHYEMVGRELIEGDLYKHLYIPKRAIGTGNVHQRAEEQRAENEKPQRSRRAAGVLIAKIPDDAVVPCTKCKRDCAGRFELYRHMLDCVGDYAWLMAKKRFKYRYYGNRSRRRKSNARSIFGCVRPKKAHAKKERMDRIKRRKMRSRRKPQKPSDAETIEKMLANLPEKRVSRTVTTPPNSTVKPSTPAKSNSSATSTTIPAPAATPLSASSSTGKKQPVLANKSGSAGASGIKRNLRSTLEAVVETANSKAAGKKGKVAVVVATEKKEVRTKAAAPVASILIDKVSESEKPKEDETGPEVEVKLNEAVGGVKDGDKAVAANSTNDADGKAVAGAPPGKRKNFITRLASNTKGMIKKIGRKMKKKGDPKSGGKAREEEGVKEAEAKETAESEPNPVDFLGEAAQGRGEAELGSEKSTVLPADGVEGKRVIESASVADERKEELKSPPLDQSNNVSGIEIILPMDTTGSQKESPSTIPSEKVQETANNSHLAVPDLLSPQISPSLSVPSNLSSPMASPSMQKRRVRKLNDCIARLTDKLQEKLGKPFIEDQAKAEVAGEVKGATVAEKENQVIAIEDKVAPETPIPLDVPLNLSLKKDDNYKRGELNSGNLLTVAAPAVHLPPISDACEVVDLSIKDKPNRKDLLTALPLGELQKTRQESLPLPIVNPPPPPPMPLLMDPQQQLRIQEEFLKLKMNLIDPSLMSAKGDNQSPPLIVPQIPKLGNYEVIKIPTYLPQKPVKGGSKRGRGAVAVAAPVTAAAVSKKSSTTSAIEKITEMVADIVRNKKRNAALKELAECTDKMAMGQALGAIPQRPVVPPAEEPVQLVTPVEVVVEDKAEEQDKGVSRREGGEIITVNHSVTNEVKDKKISNKKRTVKETPVVKVVTDLPSNLPEDLGEASKKTELTNSVKETTEIIQEPVIHPPKTPIEPEVAKIATVDEIPIHVIDKRELLMAPAAVAAAKPPNKPRAAAKGSKKKTTPPVLVVPESPVLEEPQPTPSSSRKAPAQEKKGKGKSKATAAAKSEETEKAGEEEEVPIRGNNGKKTVKQGKENKKVTIVDLPVDKELIPEITTRPIPTEPEVIPDSTTTKATAEKETEGVSKSPVNVTAKVRKKRQSELAQILADQPVINNTERDISLTRRKSVSFPEATKRTESPKLKPSPPKKKKENAATTLPKEEAEIIPMDAIDILKGKDDQEKELPKVVNPIEREPLPVENKISENITSKTSAKSKLRGNKNAKKKEPEINPPTEDKRTPEKSVPVLPAEVSLNSPLLVEDKPPGADLPKNPTPKPKKKRRSELTQIIADQLLESFKEVDESQKDNLKILHDLSWADETMEIASRLKQSPTPRRQVTKKALLQDNPRRSPLAVSKLKNSEIRSSSQEKTPSPLSTPTLPAVQEQKLVEPINTRETSEDKTALVNSVNSSSSPPDDRRPKELTIPSSSSPITTLESDKLIAALPVGGGEPNKDQPSVSPSSTTTASLFNTPIAAHLAATQLANSANAKLASLAKAAPPAQAPVASEDMSLFGKQQQQQSSEREPKETNLERRLDWVSKASELNKSGNVSDESVTNKQSKSVSSLASGASSASASSTFVLKPSRLQAIASPPLVESFDQLRNCGDRSSNSSTFCSPVVSPIGESKTSLLNALAFPVPARHVVNVAPMVAHAAVNLLQFRDAHREVDESDGDLEDNVSVHSSDSMESSMTSMTKSKAPRKRRKRSLLTKKKVRGQGAVKANKENGPGGGGGGAMSEKYHCEICNKTFEKADRLAKHKITLTHISRLSEIEFLNSQNAKAGLEIENASKEAKESPPVVVESIAVLPNKSPEREVSVESAGGVGATVAPTVITTSPPIPLPNHHHRSPLTAGMHPMNQSTLHNVHLEPISSPEQPQPQSYLMSSSSCGMPQVGGARTETAFGAALSCLAKRPNMSVSGLSQEEKLFYEVCNMLKGSDRVGTQSENNSLTPRSNEAVSTWYSKTSTAFAIRSPTSSSYRQRSPKYAFSKIDLNQFSDISSDSDNPYPSRGRPLVNGGVAPSFQNLLPTANNNNKEANLTHLSGPCNQPTAFAMGNVAAGVAGVAAAGGVVSPLRRDGVVDVYSDSDMGDSFPSAPGASDNENYVRTILDRSKNNGHLGYAAAAGRAEAMGAEWPQNGQECVPDYRKMGASFKVAEEQQSLAAAAGKTVKTKAAMKGFDNFRVSIPTEGLDMHQALGGGAAVVHNPHVDSKLASLADIALRSSTLPLIENAIIVMDRQGATAEEGEQQQASGYAAETIKDSLEDSFENEATEKQNLSEVSTASIAEINIKTPPKKAVKNGRRTQTRTDKNSIGNRLGFKAKKRKGAENSGQEAAAPPPLDKSGSGIEGGSSSKNGLDVYDFDDSQGSIDAPILPMKKCGKTPSKPDDAMGEEVAIVAAKKASDKPVISKPVTGRPKKTKGQLANDSKVAPVEPDVVLEPSSQISSDSFSDRDEFNYNLTAPEDSDASSSRESPVEAAVPPSSTAQPAKPTPAPKKVAKKPLDNVQKKCLIMGRIFKNAQKNHKPQEAVKAVSTNNNPQPPAINNASSAKEAPKKPRKVELDQLFDSLKGDPPLSSSSSNRELKEASRLMSDASDEPPVKSKPSHVKKGILKEHPEQQQQQPPRPVRPTKREEKQQAKASLEEEHNFNDNLAVGQRKSKRKCIQQVNFVETWSSDEYEEFQSTKDIFALIEANEKRSTGGGGMATGANTTTGGTTTTTTKKKKLPSATVEEPLKRIENKSKAAGKIANRRKTIGFKETDEDLLSARRTVMSGRYSPVRPTPAAVKSVTFKETPPSSPIKTAALEKDGARQVAGRQKRVSSEKLYYWSSSSSAEEDGGGGGAKASRGKGKSGGGGGGGGAGAGAADVDDKEDECAMEQHGWIVGGSHKKLVTLLAHAKGKKTDGTLKK